MRQSNALPFLLPLLLSLPLPAQEVTTPPPREPAATTPAHGTRAARQQVLVTLSFPGGTMAAFVAQIRASHPDANVIVAAPAATAVLPAIDVRSAELHQALQAACSVADYPGEVRVSAFPGSGLPVYSVVTHPGRRMPVGNVESPAEPLHTQVTTLNRLTADAPRIGFTIEVILSAITTAGEVGGAPTLRYHRESGLLVLRGKRGQLDLAQSVLRQLESDVEARRAQENLRKNLGNPDTLRTLIGEPARSRTSPTDALPPGTDK